MRFIIAMYCGKVLNHYYNIFDNEIAIRVIFVPDKIHIDMNFSCPLHNNYINYFEELLN